MGNHGEYKLVIFIYIYSRGLYSGNLSKYFFLILFWFDFQHASKVRTKFFANCILFVKLIGYNF